MAALTHCPYCALNCRLGLTQPLVRRRGQLVPTDWQRALNVAAEGFTRP